MPRTGEPTPGPYAQAVADAIALVMDDMSQRELGRLVGMSSNYLSIRFRKEASFTVTDVERIGKVLGFDAGEFLGSVEIDTDAVITPFPGVGGARDAVANDERYAASTDDSLPDEGEHIP